MSFLLDTCFLSEFVKEQPNQQVIAWTDQQPEDALYISALTLGEIQQGIVQMTRSKRRTTLETWLEVELMPRFTGRTLEVTREIALAWGKIQGEAKRRGRPLSVIDGLIAATALVHHLTVVTRNVADMQVNGVELINPWE